MTSMLRDRWDRLTSTPFSNRNPLVLGAVALVLAVLIIWGAFNPSALHLVSSGRTYSAYFTEAAGLRSGDDVRIAGVNVGKVKSVGLQGDKVKVAFSVKGAYMGNQSTAAIKIKTLLGAKYLAVDPVGESKLVASQTIPESRTSSPYDIYPVITQLTDTIDNINTDALAKAFDTLSTDFAGTPQDVGTAVRGLTRLSQTIATRDTQLRQLLSGANKVTGVLASRDAQLQKLLNDGGALLDELNSRRDAIHSLLVNTAALSVELQGLVSDNQQRLAPLLSGLKSVLALLQRNEASLDKGLSLLGPYYRVINNVVGNGRWFDSYIQNVSLLGFAGYVGIGTS
ncbi:MAG TPA: MCE family protein [Jatrophihabitans sp.]